jgi:hypothetical protein
MKRNRSGVSFWERWANIGREYSLGGITKAGYDYDMAGLRLTSPEYALLELQLDFEAGDIGETLYRTRFAALKDIYGDLVKDWEIDNGIFCQRNGA